MSSVNCPGSSPDYAMIEHSKFQTVSGMEGDDSLLLARTLALSDDNFLNIMLYKFLSKYLFFLLSLIFSSRFSLLSFPFSFFLSFFWSLRVGGDPPLTPHGSATALIHYTIRLAYGSKIIIRIFFF